MSKTAAQIEARKRRKAKAKELRDLGRAAVDKLTAAEASVSLSESERWFARKALENLQVKYERVTADFAEIRRERDSLGVLLEGVKAELRSASSMLALLEHENQDRSAEVADLKKELEVSRAADSDAKSLRTRRFEVQVERGFVQDIDLEAGAAAYFGVEFGC
jgi:chromosome segregation ATPase